MRLVNIVISHYPEKESVEYYMTVIIYSTQPDRPVDRSSSDRQRLPQIYIYLGQSISSRNEFIFLLSCYLTEWFCVNIIITLSSYYWSYSEWFIYCKYFANHLQYMCCTYGIQSVPGIISLLRNLASK